MKKLLLIILLLGCDNTTEPKDCAGVSGGAAEIDDCGLCTGGTTGLIANYLQDCAGECGGNAEIDDCGICSGDNSTCEGCDGIPNSGLILDCAEVCGGDAIENECGCVLGNTNLTEDFCYGCLDIEACNYSSEFIIDNNSCLYSEPFIDMQGDAQFQIGETISEFMGLMDCGLDGECPTSGFGNPNPSYPGYADEGEGDGIWQPGDRWNDVNGNGIVDDEDETDLSITEENYLQLNHDLWPLLNGVYDEGELWLDCGNDGLCVGDDGYTEPDLGENDGIFTYCP